MIRAAFSVGILCQLLCPLGDAQVTSTPPPVVTVCEVLLEPLHYDGKLVTIKGTLLGSGEGTWLFSDDCPGAMVTGDHVWPSAIAPLVPKKGSHLQIHQVDFQFNQESGRTFTKKYKKSVRRVGNRCTISVFTGVFETVHDWSKSKITYANGTYKYFGFGHLSEAPGQLILKSEDDVEVVPGCTNRK